MWEFLHLWLFVWLFSSFGLALLAVANHHHRRHTLARHELIDEELEKESVIGSMRASGTSQERARGRSAFRMGDYLLHILPLAVKLYMVDLQQ